MKIIVHVRICILALFLGLGMIGAQAQVLDTNKNHNWPRFAGNTVASMGVAFVGKTALKAVVNEERPDHSDNKSFPSGHAAIAFAAARSTDKEFRKESIWIPIAGYAAATALGVERVVSDRHHWYDVAAGAALGYGAAELTWWLSDKFLGRNSKLSVPWQPQAEILDKKFGYLLAYSNEILSMGEYNLDKQPNKNLPNNQMRIYQTTK